MTARGHDRRAGWPARKTTNQPGRPGPYSPREPHWFQPVRPAPVPVTTRGDSPPPQPLRTSCAPYRAVASVRKMLAMFPPTCLGIAGTGAHVCFPFSGGSEPRMETDSRKNCVLHRECNIFQKILQGQQAVPWLSMSDWLSCVLQTDPQSEEAATTPHGQL